MPQAAVTAKQDSLVARRAWLRKKFDALETLAMQKAVRPPGEGVRWLYLAAALFVSSHTIAYWVRRGYVPRTKALSIELLFGPDVVTKEELVAQREEVEL